MWLPRLMRHVAAMLVTILLGGLLAATMVRLAPGFDVDERELDPRLSPETVAALKAERAGQHNILHFYVQFLGRALKGDLGQSQVLNQPVRQLVADRLPATAWLAGAGLLASWTLAFALAVIATMSRSRGLDLTATVFSGMFLCVPAAVLGLLTVLARSPAYLAIACVVFPKLFRYSRNLLADSYEMPHVLMARAKGLSSTRVLFWHVLPVCAQPLLALAGISVSLALGACIPVEALCGIPGVGQLAWQAAIGRDLPLLVTLTVLVTVITLLANSSSDMVAYALRPEGR